MKKTQKEQNADFVNDMAAMGKNHADILLDALETIAGEVDRKISDADLHEIDRIFIEAGRGAYLDICRAPAGALQISLGFKDYDRKKQQTF